MKNQHTLIQDITKKYSIHQQNNLSLFEVPTQDIAELCTQLYQTKDVTLKLITATNDPTDTTRFTIYYVFGLVKQHTFLIPYITLAGTTEFPSLTATIYQATNYEREIATFFGLTPIGHQHLQPMILHRNWPKKTFPLRKSFKWNTRPPIAEPKSGLEYVFQKVEGEGIYEIPVGPVHAGIIEPGHFRFSVAGEEIVQLEPMLGYVHKGTEKLFEVLPLAKKVQLAEHVSGDTSFTHSLAFCQAVESLAKIIPPDSALFLRTLFSELERLANHLGDIGFIMNDTGFSFGGAQFTRLREVVMQLNERLTGHRFLRGVNRIGGVTQDIARDMIPGYIDQLEALEKDFSELMEICEDTESVANRLKRSGVLQPKVAIDHGVVGVAARASGIAVDTRLDFPYAAYAELQFQKAAHHDGDVFARYQVRAQEVHSSIEISRQVLKRLEKLPVLRPVSSEKITLPKNAHAIGVAEAWRGEVVYFVMTDQRGEITRVSVRDPSFLNWPAVPHAVTGNIVPDFPLINKSFNLSYSGYDR